jgi:putative membrane protein
MVKALIIMWLVLAAAIALAAAIVPSVEVEGGFLTLLWVALLFGLVNGLIGPLVRLISLPLTMLTFGLFALVINGLLLALTAGLSDNLQVGGFFGAIVAALLISIFTTLLGVVVGLLSGDRDSVAA